MRLYTQLAVNNQCYLKGVPMTPKGIMVHSTGANNPNLKRYVQPDDGRLGKNPNGNSMNEYRPGGRQVCPHAFIGKLADGSIATYQILPWSMRGWHSGKGSRGSANNMGYIGFEICEDGLDNATYFGKVYREAVELTAHLCKMFSLDPRKDGVILDHKEGHARGIASNHGDVQHWFRRYGKTMNSFRADVARLVDSSGGEDEVVDVEKLLSEMTDEQAARLVEKANRHISAQPEPLWSQTDGWWTKATKTRVVDGSAPNRPMTRAETVAVMGRLGVL